jgi:hypothetical protein
MGVSDRVIGDPFTDYVPNFAPSENVTDTRDATNFPGGNVINTTTNVRPTNNEGLANTFANKTEWALLKDPKEWSCLQNALISKFSK